MRRILFALALLAGCSGEPDRVVQPGDEHRDPDGRRADAGPREPEPDAGPPDAGPPDAGSPDAGSPDAGSPGGAPAAPR